MESFRELRSFPKVKDAGDELQFTRLLQHIYRRHTNVVPVMAMGVAGAQRERSHAVHGGMGGSVAGHKEDTYAAHRTGDENTHAAVG